MPTITYIERSGEQHQVSVENGKTIMEGAVENSLDGLIVQMPEEQF